MPTATAEPLSTERRPELPAVDVVGVPFHVCDYDDVLKWLADRVDQQGAARYVCVSNVADVMSARQDDEYRQALAAADLVVPDGAPIVWALRDYGCDIDERVYGPTLMQLVLDDESLAAERHLLIGGCPDARKKIRGRFPAANWAGEIDFRFDDLGPAEYDDIARQYDELDVDFAWISLGGGRQVKFMHRLAPLVARGTMLGVGAAFDFHSGRLSQAPDWMQRNGLEWCFRLAMEPRRLWHRYLIHNPPFLWHWYRERHSVPTYIHPASDVLAPTSGSPNLNGAGASTAIRLSVVVPMFNERESLPMLIESLIDFAAAARDQYECEFVLVDDGSTDDTATMARELIADRDDFRLIRHAHNRGIAAAIHTGLIQSRHPIVASIDADGSYDVRLLHDMVPLIDGGADLVTASPYHADGEVEGVPPWRLGVSKTASRLYRGLMPQPLSCYTSCFRVYRRSAFVDFPPQKTGFVGIVELLWNAQRRGLRVAEVPARLGIRKYGQSKMRVAGVTLGHARFMSRIAAKKVFHR